MHVMIKYSVDAVDAVHNFSIPIKRLSNSKTRVDLDWNSNHNVDRLTHLHMLCLKHEKVDTNDKECWRGRFGYLSSLSSNP